MVYLKISALAILICGILISFSNIDSHIARQDRFEARAATKQLLEEAKQILDEYDIYNLGRTSMLDEKIASDVAQLWSKPSQVEAVVKTLTDDPSLQEAEKKLGLTIGVTVMDSLQAFEFRSWEHLLPGQDGNDFQSVLKVERIASANTGWVSPVVIASIVDTSGAMGRPNIAVARPIP